MDTVRTYGKKPYSVAVLHGGPGAKGSAALLAKGLGNAVELLQTKGKIEDLLEEMREQIAENCEKPVVLLGHSWGAWLGGLFAETYPAFVKKLILIGAAPLEQKYVTQIAERRKGNMTEKEQMFFDKLLQEVAEGQQQSLEQLKKLVKKSDFVEEYCWEGEEQYLFPVDGEQYASVWAEAETLRKTGILLEKFRKITCPIVVIQGEQDPHPLEGVVEPLERVGVAVESYCLPECGHTPWKEKKVREEFFALLESMR